MANAPTPERGLISGRYSKQMKCFCWAAYCLKQYCITMLKPWRAIKK